MKILLDPQIFNDQNYGGISRYYTEIFVALKKANLVTLEVPLLFTSNIYYDESELVTSKQKRYNFWLTLLANSGISVRKKVKKINSKEVIKSVKSQDFDVFVSTYYNPYFLEYLNEKPFVLTVYDMIHELYPEYFKEDSTAKNKLLLLEKASKIIAVSNNTKRDIIKIYPHIPESKIEVIYHGNSIKVHENVEVNLPLNYILFVGERKNYKNFIFLIDSIKELLKSNLNLFLVCAGGGKFSNEEKKHIDELGLTDQIIQRRFEENELGLYYKNAKCFVFPSLYEGFGIPVVESMSCGCPVVLSNHSSFPEVAGDAGIYFEVNNSRDLQNKISSLINDDDLRQKYIEKGLNQIKKFDWKEASLQCLEAYKEALRNNK